MLLLFPNIENRTQRTVKTLSFEFIFQSQHKITHTPQKVENNFSFIEAIILAY